MDGTHADISGAAYGGSKFAVNGITKYTAFEYGPYNIRVNSVCPGAIDTDIAEDISTADNTRYIPLRRVGSCDDVSSLVIFLASDESAYITGSDYLIDGGLSCHIQW